MRTETMPYDYMYGHVIEDDQNLIVSSGLGTSQLPFRFGSRPEIVQIILEPEIYG